MAACDQGSGLLQGALAVGRLGYRVAANAQTPVPAKCDDCAQRYPTMGLRSGPARRSLFWDLVRYIKRSSTEVLRVQLYGYVFFNAYLRARCCIVVGFVAASDEEQARAAR